MELTLRLGYAIEKDGSITEFDCKICRKRELDKKISCFKYNRTQEVRQAYPRDGRYKIGDTSNATFDQTWTLLLWMEEWWPERNVLVNCHVLGVCPQGLITRDLERYMELEAMCEVYKTSPAGGTMEEWPAKMFDAFRTIRNTHNVIRKEQSKSVKDSAAQKAALLRARRR